MYIAFKQRLSTNLIDLSQDILRVRAQNKNDTLRLKC